MNHKDYEELLSKLEPERRWKALDVDSEYGFVMSKEFLKHFFRDNNGYLEIRAIRKFDDGKVDIKRFFYQSLEELDEQKLRELNKTNYGIYFGVCPRRSKKGSKESVLELPGIWVDVDGKDHGGKQNALKKINDTIQSINLRPSIAVDSGNGYHLYYLFKEPIPVEVTRIPDLEGYIKGISKLFGGDSTHDIGRVMRIPYFYNVKDINNPILCKLIEV